MTQGKQSKRFQIYRQYSIMNLEQDYGSLNPIRDLSLSVS